MFVCRTPVVSLKGLREVSGFFVKVIKWLYEPEYE